MSPALFDEERLLFTPAVPAAEAVPVVFAFPNEYAVGITSLGYQVIWAMLASRPDLRVSREFTDWREASRNSPELLGFSLSWELDYANLLNLLEQRRIPIHAEQRTEEHPLVFGGGPVLTANPEPFASYFDLILLGDGEELLGEFLDAYQQVRNSDRWTQLKHLAQVPGVYVPAGYQATYAAADGPLLAVEPVDPAFPARITKRTFRGNTLSASTVVTPKAAWENIYMVETVRSCPEMCRFCLASYLTLPFRTPDVETSLIPAIERGLQVTDRIGLLGASVTQHPEFETLLDYFARPEHDQVRLSLASVRAGTLTEKLARTLTEHDTHSVTIAVESGSERLRQLINKKLDQEEIRQAARAAKAGGLKAMKLYGMVGIPGEEWSDLEHTLSLMQDLRRVAPGLRLTLGCSTFVPKAHTPFQWSGVDAGAEKKLKFLQKHLGKAGIDFRPESYNGSVIQAVISRGDRRVAQVLERVRQYGSNLESASAGSFRRAFKELRGQLPDLAFYVHAEWSIVGTLPWSHLQGPLPLGTLLKHRSEAFSQQDLDPQSLVEPEPAQV
ncbi:radical SAM protein [Leptolyngbya sp. FACHB-261]|uniref:B12-binding domain-containing radical SAM protein n=1 Tax=Leptolyngbya sp. FACHB-261 TaxID=2692806 RepID=UPI0016843BFB|nr:radical SAM protein [Leptolyngbya sp. FACHB-261]MBD2100761.1 radical SAM protein [Leptolyngbya sp. FACHB-261]